MSDIFKGLINFVENKETPSEVLSFSHIKEAMRLLKTRPKRVTLANTIENNKEKKRMSYDLTFNIKAGGEEYAELCEIYDINFTYNYSPLWYHLDLDIHEMRGEIGNYREELAKAKVKFAEMSEEESLSLIRGHGDWGNVEDFAKKLDKLWNFANKFPLACIRVS